jgi:hypothetical protein
MPSPEHPPPPGPEREPRPFCLAARFRAEATAGRSYARAQQAIFAADCDLSAYRFQLDQAWHVAVLGAPPTEELTTTLTTLLATGESVTLPAEVVQLLAKRRAEQRRFGSWVEGHYRPGKRLGPDH